MLLPMRYKFCSLNFRIIFLNVCFNQLSSIAIAQILTSDSPQRHYNRSDSPGERPRSYPVRAWKMFSGAVSRRFLVIQVHRLLYLRGDALSLPAAGLPASRIFPKSTRYIYCFIVHSFSSCTRGNTCFHLNIHGSAHSRHTLTPHLLQCFHIITIPITLPLSRESLENCASVHQSRDLSQASRRSPIRLWQCKSSAWRASSMRRMMPVESWT